MTINNFVLIIGSMKCGTTSLFNYLAEHPEVAPCSEKEPAFFAKSSDFSQGFEFYQNLWEWDNSKHKIALEASTAYTRSTHQHFLNAAEKIATYRDLAKFKFIYVVRDPLERIEAHYNHGLAYDFPECQGVNDNYINQEILDTSKYAMQLDEYYSRFDSDDIFLVDFNQLKVNPSPILKDICSFLNIDSDYSFKSLGVVHNSRKERRKIDLPLWNSLKNQSWTSKLVQSVPSSYKTQVRNLIGKKVNPNFKLSSSQKSLAIDSLREDLGKLVTQYDFNIKNWQVSKQIK